jgi:hypothetical protein
MRRIWRRQWPVLVLATATIAVLIVHLVVALYSRDEPSQRYPTTNYSVIEDGLTMGGMLAEPPSGTQAVLNVGQAEDPYQAEVHRWRPIPDDPKKAPSLDWLREQVEFVDQQRRAGRPVFVHCQAGISRSGLVVAAYLMKRDGLTRDGALAVIRARRKIANPNPAFMQLLLEWQEVVKKPAARNPRKMTRCSAVALFPSFLTAPDRPRS